MKKLLFLIASTLSLNCFSFTTPVVDFLKSKIPAGTYYGHSNGTSCSVFVNHTRQFQAIAPKDFEVSITSVSGKANYGVNESVNYGGKGDCPVLRFLPFKVEQIFVANLATRAPCFSRFDRVNEGGLWVTLQDGVKIYRITTFSTDVISECQIDN